MDGPQAEAVKASIRNHDPAANRTLTDAMDSLSDVDKREAVAPAATSNPWLSAS